MDDIWVSAFGSIGVGAIQSFLGSSSARYNAQTQTALQMAQAYNQQAREYAQLTSAIKQQGRNNQAIVKSEAYTYANIAQNVGALELQDSQMKSILAQNKLQLGREGNNAMSNVNLMAGYTGATGASIKAMQGQVQQDIDSALSELEATRENQVYNMRSQTSAMYTQFYQNQRLIDTSTVEEGLLPQDPIVIGGVNSTRGGFLPHLVGSALNFGFNQLQQKWNLQL